MDVAFQEALAYKLAAELAYPLIQSNETKAVMEEYALQELKDVRSIDAQEGTGDKLSDAWLDSRISGPLP